MVPRLRPFWALIVTLTVLGFAALWWRQRGPTPLPGVTLPTEAEIPWLDDETHALALGAQRKKPVLIDFTADWCLPCQELDATVFHDPEVVRRMKAIVPLRLDVSAENSAQRALLEKYGVAGLPTLVFINADGHVLQSPRITGLVGVEEFLSALDALQ